MGPTLPPFPANGRGEQNARGASQGVRFPHLIARRDSTIRRDGLDHLAVCIKHADFGAPLRRHQ
jgi:hypothetical protein